MCFKEGQGCFFFIMGFGALLSWKAGFLSMDWYSFFFGVIIIIIIVLRNANSFFVKC